MNNNSKPDDELKKLLNTFNELKTTLDSTIKPIKELDYFVSLQKEATNLAKIQSKLLSSSASIIPNYINSPEQIALQKAYKDNYNCISTVLDNMDTYQKYIKKVKDVSILGKTISSLNKIDCSTFDKYVNITQSFASSVDELYSETNFSTFEEYLDSDELDYINTNFLNETNSILNTNSNVSDTLSKADKYHLVIAIISLIISTTISLITLIYTIASSKTSSNTDKDTKVTYNLNYQENKTINDYTTNNYYIDKENLDEYLNTKVKEIIDEQLTK